MTVVTVEDMVIAAAATVVVIQKILLFSELQLFENFDLLLHGNRTAFINTF
jgi:hypothetical protein